MTTPPERAAAPALVEAEGVRIRHDGAERWTPDGVSFAVHPGEVVLVLGPSGSGKSTLALALDGLVPHAVPAELDGRVRVAGVTTTESTVAELAQTVSMVFQDPDAQIVTGTLLDEVCFGPENQLVPVAEVLARGEAALRRVGLWERRHENPDRLSGGGRQRLAVACALALRSPVIVLDEPTANLDPVGIEEVYSVLGELVREHDHAIVLIEHNLDAALELVDRVLVVDRGGRLVFDGPVAEVLRGHADELLALGVWLPTAMLAGLRLRAAGHPVPELPLTPAGLTALLDALPALPPPPASAAKTDARDGGADAKETAAATTAADAVLVRGLRVRRGRSEVLHGVDLALSAGSFTAIVGVNGAGKTTLLQAIAGVLTPPRGSVELRATTGRSDGIDPARVDARRLARAVGFVFQNPEHQFVRGTVADELAHGLELQGVDADEIAERVDRMLARFGLEHQRALHPFLLSGGQKRRLSVGTALIAGAPILALDEPTFGQDRERAAELLDILSGLNAAGTTVLTATHDLQLVAEHSTHVVVMADGRVVAHGPTTEVIGSGALERAGLLAPPLARAFRAAADPAWHGVTRLTDLDTLAPAGITAPADSSAAQAPASATALTPAPAPTEGEAHG